MTDSVAARFGVKPVPVDMSLKVGIALATIGQAPIHGLRHLPVGDTSGCIYGPEKRWNLTQSSSARYTSAIS